MQQICCEISGEDRRSKLRHCLHRHSHKWDISDKKDVSSQHKSFNIKYNEMKMHDAKRERERESGHSQGRAISLMEMVHSMLLYSEVFTDLSFINIATAPLETHPGIILKYKKKNSGWGYCWELH